MENIVVGLEDEDLAAPAVGWVIERARSRPVRIRLVIARDALASNPQAAQDMLGSAASRIGDSVPGTPVETEFVDGSILHNLLEQSESADLLVIGAHPDPRMRESRTEAFPVSLAARSQCAVVIVPDDWVAREGAIVVGVDAAGDSDEAALFAAREALAAGRELEVVHTWEPWAVADTRQVQLEQGGILEATVDRIRAAYPAVRVQGVLAEAVAHDGVIASSRRAELVVLGTHRLGRESGLVLGAIHQEVMISGAVPLCVVPLIDGARPYSGQ
jgi:nucleotide-binding universal stress UspA family protein